MIERQGIFLISYKNTICPAGSVAQRRSRRQQHCERGPPTIQALRARNDLADVWCPLPTMVDHHGGAWQAGLPRAVAREAPDAKRSAAVHGSRLGLQSH